VPSTRLVAALLFNRLVDVNPKCGRVRGNVNEGRRMSESAPGCAVITGGAGGIGIAAARRLAVRGLRVVLWDKSPSAGKIARDIPGALAVEVEVTDPGSVADATGRTVAHASDARTRSRR
jgi:NADPH-dependent 2,4-dienoyl-CoA reductase/sulfur reductase-like enzyme